LFSSISFFNFLKILVWVFSLKIKHSDCNRFYQ
jgi:hypothetical protein